MATLRQIEYIRLLSSYPDTKDKDADDIRCFLLQHNKERIEDLSKQEASGLIKTLLKRPIKYVFLCGKEKFIDKKDYNRYDMLGELEACLHECKTDVNDCPKWTEDSIE